MTHDNALWIERRTARGIVRQLTRPVAGRRAKEVLRSSTKRKGQRRAFHLGGKRLGSCRPANGREHADLVTHDIGNMVGYAFAAEYPSRVRRFVLIDAPLPGVGPWDDIVRSHALWHFSFWGPDAERLVAGRERIYLDRFWNAFSARTRSTTRRLSPRGSWRCRCWRWVARSR